MQPVTIAELEAGLSVIRQSPRETGVLRMIVRRPKVNEREVLETGQLDLAEGLVGDGWKPKGDSHTADGAADFETQLTIMNSRAIGLIAPSTERWPLAGDQLFVDLDLSTENLPPGTRLSIGTAIVAITAEPHTGCRKFLNRFGSDALTFVNSALGRELNLRGVNAKVVRPGVIRVGDAVTKFAGAVDK